MSGSRAALPRLLAHGTTEIETSEPGPDGSPSGALRTVIQLDGDVITYVSVPLPSPGLRRRHFEEIAELARSLARWRGGITLVLRLSGPLGWFLLAALCCGTLTWRSLWEAYAGWGMAWLTSSMLIILSRSVIPWAAAVWIRRRASSSE